MGRKWAVDPILFLIKVAGVRMSIMLFKVLSKWTVKNVNSETVKNKIKVNGEKTIKMDDPLRSELKKHSYIVQQR